MAHSRWETAKSKRIKELRGVFFSDGAIVRLISEDKTTNIRLFPLTEQPLRAKTEAEKQADGVLYEGNRWLCLNTLDDEQRASLGLTEAEAANYVARVHEYDI